MIGKRLGHYLVLQRLGGGGMGEVYVAEDTRLARRVALKLPRSDVTDSLDRRARFQREARATASLNHPNIVHVYSVEEEDGLLFLTMELIAGRSLRELLRSGAPLPAARTLAFACQLTEGLACAHAAGVLHRDMKPANVMVTADDRIKILDFGLAKFLAPEPLSDPETPTMAGDASTAGVALGTAGYMAPEQALGKTLDPRTDLFSLGAVLFEMATGRPPFEGDTLAAVFDQLLNRQPPAPATLNPDVPAALSAIIERSLEKDPARRYRSATDLLQDLRRVERPADTASGAAVPAGAPPSSIVVLPFVDLSPAKDQEYFCHGVTDEIISSLTRVPGLRVISRTSAFAFEGKGVEITEIGRRLRVATALEGSVRKAGGRIRVTAQLVDTATAHQLWSRRFDCDLSDVFAVQDDIAAVVVDALRSGTAGERSERPPLDAGAHDAYLQGLYAMNGWTEPQMRRAIADFQRAIALDPRFAPAHAALAEAHVWLYSGVGMVPASASVPAARAAAERALSLDPLLASAHRARGLLAMNHDWDRRGARDGLARALELGPGSASSHLWNAWRLAVLEARHAEALAGLEEAERLSPLDLQVKTLIGYVHHFRHDLDRALAQFQRVASLEPSFAFAHYALGDALTQAGQFTQAVDEYERAIAIGGRTVNHLAALAYALGRAGNGERARALGGELAARSAEGYVAPMWMALVHLGLADLEAVYHWIARAFDERDGSLVLIAAAVEFDPLRSQPRFQALLTRMGLGHLSPA